MDPFEVRMQFLTLLHRLNASQQSIQKVVSYALKYFSRCGDLIWDCIVEECQKGSLNTRINILYLLDSLCEASLLSKASFGSASTSSSSSGNLYVDFVARDLSTIVDYVVPSGREGLINLMSAVQILENWRNKRVIETQKVEGILSKLESQKVEMHAAAASSSVQDASPNAQGTSENAEYHAFSRNEVFKRIEEDRERHKRLRERRWVQPLVHGPQSAPILASFAPLPAETSSPSISSSENLGVEEKEENTSSITVPPSSGPTTNPAPTSSRTAFPSNAPDLPIDIEFDNAWETTSDWNEDDDEAIAEENSLCYPNVATRFDSGKGAGPPPPATMKESYSSSSAPPLPSGPSLARTSSTPSRPPGPPPAPVPASSPQQGKRPFKIDRMRLNKFAQFSDRRGN
ncbi:hypothetical protein ACEPAG_3152 [Sanghuangporus baumii]